MGLHRFDGVHLGVASLNLRAERLYFGHQICDLGTQSANQKLRDSVTNNKKEDSISPDC